MKIAVVGTGYVGLVGGTCFAETGNEVICVDIDENKVQKMRNGEVPIYEPGLETLFERNIKQGRLTFTTNLEEAIKDAKKASYEYNKMQDKIPALSDFRNPKTNSEDFFEKFFVRSKGDDFVSSYNSLDNAGKQVIKNNLLGHIKRAMTGDTTNDFAKVSAKGLERVLNNIGKKKLEAVFSREELLQIQALKRVAKSDSFMPVGSAVNTSNTASTLTKDFGAKIPLLQNAINNSKVNKAIDVDNNAIRKQLSKPAFLNKPGLLLPTAFGVPKTEDMFEDEDKGLLN